MIERLVTPLLPVGQKISPPDLARWALTQKISPKPITSGIIALCQNFPEQVQTLTQRRDFQMTRLRQQTVMKADGR
jgi:hypothetical protein